MFVHIEPLISFIAAPRVLGPMKATTIVTRGAPAFWFHGVPGVQETGPLNFHLVRDVGCAYLVAAGGLVWRAINNGAPGESAAVLAAGFLLLHAGVHLWEVAVGMCGWSRFLQDMPGVVVPGFLVLWLSRADAKGAIHA